jgi:hypothetical protein
VSSTTVPTGTEPPSQPPTTDVISAARQAVQDAAQQVAQQTGQSQVTEALLARGYGLIDSERGRTAYQLVEHLQSTFLDDRVNQRTLLARQQADQSYAEQQRQQYLAQQQELFYQSLRHREVSFLVALSAGAAFATAIQSGSQGDATALAGAIVQVLDKIASLSPPANATGQPAGTGA